MCDHCDFPRCKNLSDLGYIGHWVCNKHWVELCEADDKAAKRLLKKIGLVRNKSGAIVPITPRKKN